MDPLFYQEFNDGLDVVVRMDEEGNKHELENFLQEFESQLKKLKNKIEKERNDRKKEYDESWLREGQRSKIFMSGAIRMIANKRERLNIELNNQVEATDNTVASNPRSFELNDQVVATDELRDNSIFEHLGLRSDSGDHTEV